MLTLGMGACSYLVLFAVLILVESFGKISRHFFLNENAYY